MLLASMCVNAAPMEREKGKASGRSKRHNYKELLDGGAVHYDPVPVQAAPYGPTGSGHRYKDRLSEFNEGYSSGRTEQEGRDLQRKWEAEERKIRELEEAQAEAKKHMRRVDTQRQADFYNNLPVQQPVYGEQNESRGFNLNDHPPEYYHGGGSGSGHGYY
jgi:hypothetical protein